MLEVFELTEMFRALKVKGYLQHNMQYAGRWGRHIPTPGS